MASTESVHGIESTSDPMSVVEKINRKPSPQKLRKLRTVRLGVWELTLAVKSKWQFSSFTVPSFDGVIENLSSYKLFFRLLRDIYSLAPLNLVVFLLQHFISDLKESVILYIDSRLWEMISDGLGGQPIDALLAARCLVLRLFVTFSLSWFSSRCVRSEQILQHRIKLFFMEKSMEVNLMLDLVTAEDPDIKSKSRSSGFPGRNEMWNAFTTIVSIASGLLTGLSQIVIVSIVISRHTSGWTFFLLSFFQPLIYTMVDDSLWNKSFASICVNKAYERLATLHRFAFWERFRMDRISDGVAGYIKKEFKRSRKELGDESINNIAEEWSHRSSLVLDTFNSFLDDFEIVYFTLKIIFGSKGLSFSTVAILKTAASSLSDTLYSLTYQIKSVSEGLAKVKETYSQWDIQNQMKDGDVPYPRIDQSRNSTGMELEFRNVSFKYPGTDRHVLKDISFKIKPGQMVVIVGVNGSGKSSTTKLFNRLYDVTEGEILVDGLPISMYKLEDLRRTMAILRQDHCPYPLSLRLNVALGCPDREELDDDEIRTAIEAGGADEFIKKLPNGLDTVLEPVELSTVHFEGEVIEEMNQIVKKKEQETDISGGESQRLASSRTFMRLNGGGIRFLAADEPTSALDPHGELTLFNRLREQRGEKTVVFITHRFGHLTKYADLILVLKDGHLVDSGTHDELVLKEGEYKDLYDVQAQAFLPQTVSE